MNHKRPWARFTFGWLAWMLLSGCSPYVETTSLGVFEFTDHMRRDPIRWEGGNTYLAYREICNKATGQCWRWDPRARMGSFELVPVDSGRVVIVSVNRDERGRSVEILVFDSNSGDQIECENCPGSVFESDVRLISANVQAELVVVYIRIDGEYGRDFAYALDVRPQRYRMYEIFNVDLVAGVRMIGVPVLSPDGGSAAWYECADECRMITTALGGKEGRITESIDCIFEPGKFIGVNWVGGSAEATCY